MLVSIKRSAEKMFNSAAQLINDGTIADNENKLRTKMERANFCAFHE